MNLVTLPNGKPIWGGTYFRKNEWINSLEQLQELYQSNPEKILDYAEKLHQGLQATSIIERDNSLKVFNQETLENLVVKWQ
jgi:uncharacterized protein YyaL (SSP411 family)